MAVAFDAVGPSSSGHETSTTPNGWNHTAAVGAALIVAAAVDQTPTSVACTYNSVAMTLLGSVNVNNNSAGTFYFWGLANCGTGSSLPVSISWSGSSDIVAAGSVSYTGAATTTGAAFGPFAHNAIGTGTGQSDGTNPSLAFTSTSSSSMVVWGLASGQSTITAPTNATSRYLSINGSSGDCGSAGAADTAGTGGVVTCTWTIAAGSNAVGAVEVLPPSAPAASFFSAVARQPPTWRTRYRPRPRLQSQFPLGQPTRYLSSDSSGPEADAGEQTVIKDATGESSGPEVDAGEAVTASLSDTDAGHSHDNALGPSDPGLAVPGMVVPGQPTQVGVVPPVSAPAVVSPPTASAQVSATWVERFRPYRKLVLPLTQPTHYLDGDFSGPEADAGEQVVVRDATGESSGPEVDAGEAVTASLSDTDSSHGTDAGEQLLIMSAPTVVALSRTWQQRYRPRVRQLQLPLAQPSVYVDSDYSHGTDAGESIAATLSSSDTSGPETDAGESISATGITSSDACHGTDAGESVVASLSSSDTSGPETDNTETVAATLSSADTSGPELDAGESVAAFVLVPAAVVRPSPLWLSRYRPRPRVQLPLPVVLNTTPSDTDGSTSTDSGSVAATLSDTDASTSLDNSERIGVTDTDSSHETDGGEANGLSGSDTCHGTDAGESVVASLSSSDASGPETDNTETVAASLSDTDASGPEADAGEQLSIMSFSLGQALVGPAWLTRFGRQRFPQQLPVFLPPPSGGLLVTDTDACHGEDAEFDFPSGTDASGAGLDAGESVTAFLNSKAFTSDASGAATDSEQKAGAYDTDTSTSADSGYLSSAQFSSADSSTGTDSQSAQFGPSQNVSDTDASVASDQQIIDVYAYQPLFRFDGGQFEVPLHPRFPVPPPPQAADPLAVTLAVAEALVVHVEITRSSIDPTGE